jgi:hypothetical protein
VWTSYRRLVSGVSFEEAWKARISATIEGDTPINVISREHLLQNKRAAGRPKDLLDVTEIEKAGQEQKKVKPVLKKQTKGRGR